MNTPIRRVAVACLVLFLALLANDNWVQVLGSRSLENNPHNVRASQRNLAVDRGPIAAAGQPLAKSVPVGDAYKYERNYPQGPEYAAATGYFSIVYGASGVEQAENGILNGTDDRFSGNHISDLITGNTPKGGSVTLTLDPAAQDAAYAGMKGLKGAVVALDPATGKILALVSTPSYDPNLLASHDTSAVTKAWQQLTSDPANPMLDKALREHYAPGSLFKIVTSAAALSTGRYSPDTQIDAPNSWAPASNDRPVHNFGNESCSSSGQMSLQEAFAISCNTAFAELGTVGVGARALQAQAQAFGFGQTYDVPMHTVSSTMPDNPSDEETMLDSIGQGQVVITPLQAAMLAAAVGNGGVVMKPYLVDQLQGPDLKVISQTAPQQLGRAVSSQVASQLTQMMVDVVDNGTGTPAGISGVQVAGKTGTAQVDGQNNPNAWFVAFAPADHPKVAVAVLVLNGGSRGSDATGGKVAAPIAKSVIKAVLGQ